MPKVQVKDLLFVSKSHKEQLDYLAAGASLVARTGLDLKKLRIKAANDRLALASDLVKEANSLRLNGSLCRSVVSRAYYAMYHAVRAATYHSYGGDDHEQHTVLPSKLPLDFPDHKRWQNALKNARLERNRADYDPYPRRDNEFQTSADNMLADAKQLVALSKKYLIPHLSHPTIRQG